MTVVSAARFAKGIKILENFSDELDNGVSHVFTRG
jgi:hypothetical protein